MLGTAGLEQNVSSHVVFTPLNVFEEDGAHPKELSIHIAGYKRSNF